MPYIITNVAGVLQPDEDQRQLLEWCANYYYQQYSEARQLVIHQLQQGQEIRLSPPTHQDDTKSSIAAAAYWHCKQEAANNKVPLNLRRRCLRFKTATQVDCSRGGIYIPELGTIPWIPQTTYEHIVGPPLITQQVHTWLVWLPTAQQIDKAAAREIIPFGAKIQLDEPVFHSYKWNTLWEPAFLKKLQMTQEVVQPKEKSTASRPLRPRWPIPRY